LFVLGAVCKIRVFSTEHKFQNSNISSPVFHILVATTVIEGIPSIWTASVTLAQQGIEMFSVL
jgi:hypothetical protein